MSAGLEKLAMRVASDPAKSAAATVAIIEAAPILVPVAALGTLVTGFTS